jgi:hypothetical protein
MAKSKQEQCTSDVGEVVLTTAPDRLHPFQQLLLALLKSFQRAFQHDQPVQQSVLLKGRIRLGLQVLQLDLDAVFGGESALATEELDAFLLLGSDLLEDG